MTAPRDPRPDVPDEWSPLAPGAIRGRGAAENPTNRFERLAYVPEADAEDPDDDLPALPPTVYLRDPTRTALARNNSPDVNFDTSLNPYRGCEHGCTYCVSPETRVLHADMIWRPIGDVRLGDRLVGFDEYPRAHGTCRKLRAAVVLGVWWSRKRTRRLVTGSSDVIATPDHRWLQHRDFRWSRTDQLAAGQRLRRLPVPDPEREDEDYRAGYIAGLSLGGGTFRCRPGPRSDGKGFPAACWRVALADVEPLRRIERYLASFGVDAAIRSFDPGPKPTATMQKVEVRSFARLETIDKLIHVERSSRSYRRGFVSGLFDAEGQNGTSMRVSQDDLGVLERFRGYAASLGFDFVLEPPASGASSARLVGSLAERMRFFGTVQPAISRKVSGVFGRNPATLAEPIEAVEPGPVRDVVDIQTSTGTFYAEGLATHNCYARPTHEYLGFSSGLDFETRILVKENAPELLRKELSAKRWKPQVVGMCGVTDAYQPVERRLGLTRRCLQVFAEFRNPVQIITKNALVARDTDVLLELAARNATSVTLSITTLDSKLHRIMEPRASHPVQRLGAVEALARAGIPVGVNVAPIIPGLTDHEIPAILAAAREAGAEFAGHIVLRLPRNVKELFSAWLDRHHPERKDKVLNRLRALRRGQLDDPRFGTRMKGDGIYAAQIHDLFELSRRRAGFETSAEARPPLSTAAFRRPGDAQLALF